MNQSMQKEPRTVISYKRMYFLMLCVFIFIAVVAAQYIINMFFTSRWMYLLNIIPLLMLFFAIIAPRIRYNTTSFYVHTALIECSTGIFLHKRSLIPIDRIQYIKISNGPLSRKYQLSRLTLCTTGDIVNMPYLRHEDAQQLSALINQRVKEVSAYV